MYDNNQHSHISFDRFKCFIDENVNNMSPSSSNMCFDNTLKGLTVSPTYDNWSNIHRVVDKVHKHVCGHFTYSDMKTLPQCTNLWNDQTQNYLSNVISNCPACKASATPPLNRRLSLASLNREFNHVVCMYHMFLNDVTVFHMMDVATRLSVGAVVDSTSMENEFIKWKTCALHNSGLQIIFTSTEHFKTT